LALFVGKGESKVRGGVVFCHISAGTYTQSCENLLLIGLVAFLRHPHGAMMCETACIFTGYRAHSALMGDGGTGSFLSSDPPDPTEIFVLIPHCRPTE
jgi:hypothetical protein